jgi:hypothetical protein
MLRHIRHHACTQCDQGWMLLLAALTMDLADLARGIRNVAVNTQDTRLARGGQALAHSASHQLYERNLLC